MNLSDFLSLNEILHPSFLHFGFNQSHPHVSLEMLLFLAPLRMKRLIENEPHPNDSVRCPGKVAKS